MRAVHEMRHDMKHLTQITSSIVRRRVMCCSATSMLIAIKRPPYVVGDLRSFGPASPTPLEATPPRMPNWVCHSRGRSNCEPSCREDRRCGDSLAPPSCISNRRATHSPQHSESSVWLRPPSSSGAPKFLVPHEAHRLEPDQRLDPAAAAAAGVLVETA